MNQYLSLDVSSFFVVVVGIELAITKPVNF